MQKMNTFLMFEGRAEEAMNFYVSVFKHSAILNISRYAANGPGKEGTVHQALFSINGQELMCIDSPPVHGFTFTPAMSLFVHCDTVEEITEAFTKLSEGGQVLMPLGPYPFSPMYAWLSDRFGVSWQLGLSASA